MRVYPLGNMHPMGSGEDDYDDTSDPQMDLIPKYRFKDGTEYTEKERKEKYENNKKLLKFSYDQLSNEADINRVLDELSTSKTLDKNGNPITIPFFVAMAAGASSVPLVRDGSIIIIENPSVTGGRDATIQILKIGDLIDTLQHEYTKSSDGSIKPTGYMSSVVHSVDNVIRDSSGKVTGVTTKGVNNFDGDAHYNNGKYVRTVTKDYNPNTSPKEVHNLFVGRVTSVTSWDGKESKQTYVKE